MLCVILISRSALGRSMLEVIVNTGKIISALKIVEQKLLASRLE